MKYLLRGFVVLGLMLVPSLAFASLGVYIGAVFPVGGTVGVGTPVSFTIVPTGYTAPLSYYLTDSFPGGATSNNIDVLGVFRWTPNHSDIGSHTFTVTVRDASNSSAEVKQTIQVVAPQVTAGAVTPGNKVTYGEQVSFQISSLGFINPWYAVEDGFFNSSVYSYNTQSNTFVWTPLFKDVGEHNLTVIARDQLGDVATTSVKITVQGPPGIKISEVYPGGTVGAGQTLNFSVVTNGLDSPALTVVDRFYGTGTSTLKFEDLPAQAGGKVTWTPVYNDLGGHLFVATAVSGSKTYTAELPVLVVSAPVIVTTPAPASASSPAANTTPKPAAGSAYVFKTYLAVGSTGVGVTELQKKLIALGYLKAEATGYFGALTKKALQEFQKANKLEQVGFVGPGTRAALNR